MLCVCCVDILVFGFGGKVASHTVDHDTYRVICLSGGGVEGAKIEKLCPS